MKYLKFSILFIALMAQVGAALGQSVVSEIPEHKADTTIVRYWQESIFIVYYRNSDNDNWFLLVDSTMPGVLRIPVPQEVTVNDFRIFNDTVFVGGNYLDVLGTKHGLLACFAINDFYNASGYYYWVVTNATIMPDIYVTPPVFDQITDITRIAVYDSNGFAKIAFIAKNRIDGEPNLRVGIGCARYNGSSWSRNFIYNKYGIEEYTDIIATKNYVVAVARTNNLAELALRIYPKTSFLMPVTPWPSYIYYSNFYGQGLSDLQVDENVMATALDDDEFAVAYHYIDSPEEGLAVKTFNIVGGSAVLTQGLNLPSVRLPGSKWEMRDICYFSSLRRLAVLNDFDGGIIGSQASIVYQFQLPTLMTGLYYGRYLPGYKLHALDPFESSSSIFVASGNNASTGLLSLFWHSLLADLDFECGLHDEIRGNDTGTPLRETFMQTNLNIPIISWGSTPFMVDDIERITVCTNKARESEQ